MMRVRACRGNPQGDSRCFLPRVLLHLADLPLDLFSASNTCWPSFDRDGHSDTTATHEYFKNWESKSQGCELAKLTARERGFGGAPSTAEIEVDAELPSWVHGKLQQWWKFSHDERRIFQLACLRARAESNRMHVAMNCVN